MQTIFHTSLVVLAVLYTALVMTYARVFSRSETEVGSRSRSLLACTIVLHLGAIALRGRMVGACPLGTPGEFLSLLACSVALLYLILEARAGVRTTGLFALALALVLQLVGTVRMLGEDSPEPVKLGFLRSSHSFASALAFSGVAFCGVYGLLYLFLYGAIKTGRFGVFFRRMPPLETLGDLHLGAVRLASLALTVTAALGVSMLASMDSPTVSPRSSEVIATASLWLFFVGALAAHRFFGFGGKRLAYSTVLVSIISVALVVTGFSLGTFHR